MAMFISADAVINAAKFPAVIVAIRTRRGPSLRANRFQVVLKAADCGESGYCGERSFFAESAERVGDGKRRRCNLVR